MGMMSIAFDPFPFRLAGRWARAGPVISDDTVARGQRTVVSVSCPACCLATTCIAVIALVQIRNQAVGSLDSSNEPES